MNWAQALSAVMAGSFVVGLIVGRIVQYFSWPEREKRAIRRKRKVRRNALRVLQGPVYDSRDSVQVFRNAMRQR